jgi:hypothetical protein
MTGPVHVRISPPRPDGLTAKVSVNRNSDLTSVQLSRLFVGLPEPPPGAAELLLAATGAYLADRAVLRKNAPDRWTRQIVLSFPCRDPDTWPATELELLLKVLTNDDWTLHPFRSARPLALGPAQQQFPSPLATGTALFSGGLDSFAHLAGYTDHKTPPLLVGHWDMPRLKSLQRTTVTNAAGHRAGERLRQLHVGLTSSLRPSRDGETSQRSRGLLFTSAGAAVALAAGHLSLTVPENGFVALNVPLTDARSGALSTRSTHPYVLHLLQRVLERLDCPLRISNPLLYATKGDVVRAGLAAGRAAVAETVSCGHPSSGRWSGDARYGNCGHCYPCLVRRSGMEAALNGNDPTRYRHDPRSDPSLLRTGKVRDLIAVAAALGNTPQPRDLTAIAPLPPHIDRNALHNMRVRSFAELEASIRRGLHADVQTRLGL